MPKCDFNEVAKQLCRNHTLAWVLGIILLLQIWCMFSKYLFKNTFGRLLLFNIEFIFYYQIKNKIITISNPQISRKFSRFYEKLKKCLKLIFVCECYHVALYDAQVIDSENWSLLLTNT